MPKCSTLGIPRFFHLKTRHQLLERKSEEGERHVASKLRAAQGASARVRRFVLFIAPPVSSTTVPPMTVSDQIAHFVRLELPDERLIGEWDGTVYA